jgi:hypothetical protein
MARSMIILPGKADGSEKGGSLTIKSGVVIKDCYSTGGAGVIRNYGTVTIDGGTFKDNIIEKNNGVFMFIGGAGQATVNGGTFQNNDAGTSNGGVFQVSDDAGVSKLTITAGTFAGNSAARGAVVNSYAHSNVTISGGSFTGNSATSNANGAAVYALGTFSITGGTFNGNSNYDVTKASNTVTIGAGASITSLKTL